MIVSFDIPDAQVPRIAAWIRTELGSEDEFGNPVTWTDAEVLAQFKHKVRQWIKGEVQQYELLKEHEASFQNYTQIDVTDV